MDHRDNSLTFVFLLNSSISVLRGKSNSFFWQARMLDEKHGRELSKDPIIHTERLFEIPILIN